MSIKLKALYKEGLKLHETTVQVDKIPDECPICDKGINPREMVGWLDHPHFQQVFLCPLQKCESLFIAYYRDDHQTSIFDFKNVAPKRFRKKEFSKIIKDISEEFCKLYNEALNAESLGLKDICGAGYRKALEFMIKDYLIRVKKKPKKEIEKKWLASCIEEYFEDGNLKTCAKRAIWLGNDETHYYRAWEDKDLKDLKDLIDVTLYWIQSEYKTKQYKLIMPDKKK